jgi:lysophospholipase L1-like esterase
MQDAYVARGDHTQGTFAPEQTIQMRAFLSGVDVLASRAQAIVVLGDSISDGVGSTANANRRWPDLFAERLSARSGGTCFGVVNHGISGNQVLADGAGQSALARFDRDVLSVPGLTHVIVFEGVNDVGLGYGRIEGPLASLMPPPAIKPTRDAVLDFDAAFRDPAKPTQMKDAFQAGDHLHGSDAGYRAVADSIDLGLFR